MRKLLIAAVVIVLGVGAWFGASAWRRHAMIASGRPLLLTNKKAGIYTYSDLIKPDDLVSSYRVVGYSDEMTKDEIAQATKGLQLVIGTTVASNDPRVPATPETFSVVPTASEQKRWNEAISTLTEQQRTLCSSVQDDNLIQPCLQQHLVYNALKNKQGTEICERMYIPSQATACKTDIEAGNIDGYRDADANGLLDYFEHQAVPYAERTNTLNLPVVNPGA